MVLSHFLEEPFSVSQKIHGLLLDAYILFFNIVQSKLLIYTTRRAYTYPYECMHANLTPMNNSKRLNRHIILTLMKSSQISSQSMTTSSLTERTLQKVVYYLGQPSNYVCPTLDGLRLLSELKSRYLFQIRGTTFLREKKGLHATHVHLVRGKLMMQPTISTHIQVMYSRMVTASLAHHRLRVTWLQYGRHRSTTTLHARPSLHISPIF